MSNYPLFNYNWDFSGNQLPISNSTFAYGQLGQIYGSGVTGGYWGSLTVSNLFSNNNALISYTNSQTNSYLTFNVSGIYQITTSLQFIPSSGFNSGTQTFVFSYSTGYNSGASSFSYSNNNIIGPISIYNSTNTLDFTPYFINGSASGGGSNTLASTNYGGQIALTTNTNNTSPFFILPNYSSSTINNNVNTITSIYYIPIGTTLYFNIGNGNTSTSNYINATGIFTARLLNSFQGIYNVNNLNVSTLQLINGYYFYTFVPTTTTSIGTATISFSGNVAMNYLLVGGGGGGGASIPYPFTTSAGVNGYSGGGGGGGQVVNSTSAISGSIFTISVGNAGTSSNVGGNTVVASSSTLVTAYGGGAGSSSSTGGAGGGGTGATGGTGLYGVTTTTPTNVPGVTQINYVPVNTATNGGSGTIVTLPFETFYLGGGGGGGGSGGGLGGASYTYGGGAGNNNTGGLLGANNTSVGSGTPGLSSTNTSYGTGGGGGGMSGYSYPGGTGGPGLVVLYWAA